VEFGKLCRCNRSKQHFDVGCLTEPDNGMPSELLEDDTVGIENSDEDDPKQKGLKTSMKNELGLNSHLSLFIRDDSKHR